MAAEHTDSAGFLNGPEVERVLDRASRVAQTPVVLHRYAEGGESEPVHACGSCAEACAYVAALPWGRQACRRSREKHAALAHQRQRPVPFICHMGFACVSAPVASHNPSQAATLTFGPFCPAEAPDSLLQDALAGLEQLEHQRREDLPFTLNDIPRVAPEVPPETAEWTAETLMKQLHSHARQAVDTIGQEPNAGAVPVVGRRSAKPSRPIRDPYETSAILAAIAGNDQRRLRALVRQVITAQPPHTRRSPGPDTLRNRTVALAGAVLEAASRAGLPAAEARERLEVLPQRVAHLEGAADLTRACLRVFAPLKRKVQRVPGDDGALLAQLDRFVQARLAEGLTLGAAAAHLGLSPTRLTRRLQQRYGLSFSEYAGRARVDRAKQLLASTSLSVETVARRVGLNDGSHLRKLFQKFEGQAPSAFRAKRGRSSPPQAHSS